jgi:hypothetical protein
MATIDTINKLIIGAVTEFMKNEISIPNVKLTVKRKNSDLFFGDVVMNDNSVNKNKFTLHWNPKQGKPMMIQSLIHELTHVKQIAKKELQPAPDYKSIYWKGKEFITVRDYKKIMKKNPNEYKNLPWEKEAYGNMKSKYKKFLQSKYWKDLQGKDATLDYIIKNI